MLLTILLALSPHTLLDSAMARMGGRANLESIKTMRIEAMTEWQRMDFRQTAPAIVSSYEWDTEYRDYTRPAWRYVRRNMSPSGWRDFTDVVVDSVAAMGQSGVW